ncbi:ABC transporter permease [Putridiphycobacter roseus]|uniref:Transport permease protein n=2 Tax=Putridiphycobacter roseus TaxID=2219161 RepID=A0A2W1NGR4_9FLAO|nr:ABC transporter permease [Putridiphycobacter roseus]
MEVGSETTPNKWDVEIFAKKGFINFGLKELLRYKDLLFLFIKRDFISLYKQTILGPLWVVIQPILTTLTFTVIFGNIAKIGTNGIPQILFYLSGITIWSYFSDCVTKTSETFSQNQNIFNKVYFPRLIVPLSIIFTNLIKFFFQFLIFIAVYLYYVFFTDFEAGLNSSILLLPVLIFIMMAAGLGIGLIISSLTVKYRDLKFLIQFGIQLAMYATPIVYPLNMVPEKYKWIIMANPMTSVIETFKFTFFDQNASFELSGLIYSFVISILLLLAGMSVFNRVERSFIDTI